MADSWLPDSPSPPAPPPPPRPPSAGPDHADAAGPRGWKRWARHRGAIGATAFVVGTSLGGVSGPTQSQVEALTSEADAANDQQLETAGQLATAQFDLDAILGDLDESSATVEQTSTALDTALADLEEAEAAAANAEAEAMLAAEEEVASMVDELDVREASMDQREQELDALDTELATLAATLDDRQNAVAEAEQGAEAAPQPVVGTTTDSSTNDGGGCHPAYDPCIPPGPPDLDCSDVNGPIRVDHSHGDPHRFDRDKDGVGCEG